ncbi:hypothetical protein TRVL_06978 [Trypanosoma vivax]|nr:hypothetical protein TRVL_06978 [Trypanosoma vivax]
MEQLQICCWTRRADAVHGSLSPSAGIRCHVAIYFSRALIFLITLLSMLARKSAFPLRSAITHSDILGTSTANVPKSVAATFFMRSGACLPKLACDFKAMLYNVVRVRCDKGHSWQWLRSASDLGTAICAPCSDRGVSETRIWQGRSKMARRHWGTDAREEKALEEQNTRRAVRMAMA